MAIRDEIDAKLRQARIDKDERTRNVIGMLKNKVLLELKSGKDRKEDDELWKEQLAAYSKQLQKAIPEFEKAGERGNEAKAEAEWELAFCNQFLPSKLDEAGTEALVRKIAADNGITSAREMGKLMGLIMKGHKDEVDGGIVKKVAAKVLA
jgi:uncharacterized protein YqeY